MADLSIYDHYRLEASDDLTDGIYRVVGVDGRTVTLLRVGTPSGQRTVTGDLHRLDADRLSGLATVDNPDTDGSAARSIPTQLYWSLVAAVIQLRRRPLAAVVTLSLLAVGVAGEGVLPIGDGTATALAVLGGLSLALVASGRL